jgi:hypothetical protein
MAKDAPGARHSTINPSPNLVLHERTWRAGSRYLGHNRSWRPYFYQLLSEDWRDHRLPLSSTYRDTSTNQYCLTAGHFSMKAAYYWWPSMLPAHQPEWAVVNQLNAD